MESKNGKARATPAPRRKLRRAMCFLVMYIICSDYLLYMNLISSHSGSIPGTVYCFTLFGSAGFGLRLFHVHLERLTAHYAEYERRKPVVIARRLANNGPHH